MKFTIILAILPGIATSFTSPSVFGAVKTTVPHTFALHATTNGAANGDGEKKKVIVLGGDGFCGWPTSLYLSDMGHDVVIVDNLSRRNIDTELGCDSLTPIQSPEVCRIYMSMYYSVCFYVFVFGMGRCNCMHVSVDAFARPGTTSIGGLLLRPPTLFS
jgi:hypothetical protein